MLNIQDLPTEILEEILLCADPVHVAAVSQACRLFHSIVYGAADQHFWRRLHLAQPLDDPRKCVSNLGYRRTEIDWIGELQRIIRARNVVLFPESCPPEERCTVLTTLINLATCARPTSTPSSSSHVSYNLIWIPAILQDGPFFSLAASARDDRERQLWAHLHTLYGLIPEDVGGTRRLESRAYVYDMRRYKWRNEFGPFLSASGGRVNWVHINAIRHVVSMHIMDLDEGQDSDFLYHVFPLSLPFCQSIIPEGVDLDTNDDWAGVNGMWRCLWCFCDHRDLMIYNNSNSREQDPLDTAIFEGPDFAEHLRPTLAKFSVVSTDLDPMHPRRPRIHFMGEVVDQPQATLVGWVKVTPDEHIRWHFVFGEGPHSNWSAEGIQIGGVRSEYGILGSWTHIFHARDDPVGPFWLRKMIQSAEPSQPHI